MRRLIVFLVLFSQVLAVDAFAGYFWSPPTLRAPTVQVFNFGLASNSNGYAYYTFTITAATVGAGSTYTNNAKTCTVVYAVTSGTSITAYCTGAPTASGTLTYASGSPTGNLTFSAQTSGGTYVLPTPAPLYLRVKAVGSGGNGGASGTAAFGTCANGGASTFGTSLLTANQGAEPSQGAFSNGAGGTVTINSPAITLSACTGGAGSGNQWSSATTNELSGGVGGVGCPGGAGGGGGGANAGQNGVPGTGGGGGGGGCLAVASCWTGAGGGAGGYLEAQINSPSATYTFQVGANGVQSCGAGTSGANAGSGGGGGIQVTEYYE